MSDDEDQKEAVDTQSKDTERPKWSRKKKITVFLAIAFLIVASFQIYYVRCFVCNLTQGGACINMGRKDLSICNSKYLPSDTYPPDSHRATIWSLED